MAKQRWWHPSLGIGDLTWMEEPDVQKVSFAAESGQTIEFHWVQARWGKPGKEPRRKTERAEWNGWETFTTEAGEVYTFRRGGPPPLSSSTAPPR